MLNGEAKGTVVLVGGAEDQGARADILGRFVELIGGRKLVVMTCATEDPAGAWRRYRTSFTELGVTSDALVHVDIRDREAALDATKSEALGDAAGVFFTGGDQLRITAHIGDTPVFDRISDLVQRGGVVAGTSAGAAVMSDTMLVGGASHNTPRIGEVVRMAPGLGFLHNYVVDIHFSERGRIGRLVGAVAQNPAVMGIGVDENTALFINDGCGEVVGGGGVWIVDGRRARGSNVSEGASNEALAIEDICIHVLNAGRRFDLVSRQPAA